MHKTATACVLSRDYIRLNQLIKRSKNVKADLNAADGNGRTALHYAAETGFCVSTLLQAGVELDIQDSTGNTALIYASCEGRCSIIKGLCEAGANANLTNSHGISPLQILTIKGHVECIEVLVKHGADMTYIRDRGVADAFEYSRYGTVLYLLRLVNDYRQYETMNPNQHPFLQALRHDLADVKDNLFLILDNADVKELVLPNSTDTELIDHIAAITSQPLALKSLTRLAVRRCMTEPILIESCELLPLPVSLKKYVSMCNIEARTSRKHITDCELAHEN